MWLSGDRSCYMQIALVCRMLTEQGLHVRLGWILAVSSDARLTLEQPQPRVKKTRQSKREIEVLYHLTLGFDTANRRGSRSTAKNENRGGLNSAIPKTLVAEGSIAVGTTTARLWRAAGCTRRECGKFAGSPTRPQARVRNFEAKITGVQ